MKLLLFAFILMTISSGSFGQQIPASWVSGMKLEASYRGGMARYSYELVITDTISHMTVIDSEGKKEYKEKFTPKKLNAILAFLKNHDFENIKSESKGFTNDKPSETVMLIWDGHVVGASQSDSMDIVKEQKENFGKIQNYVTGLFNKNKNKKK